MYHAYKVTMNVRQEDGSIRTFTRTAVLESLEAVIDWYGLDDSDIVSYTIEEIN